MEIVAVERRGFVPSEVGKGFVVVNRGAQFVALRRREISLEVEHKPCGAEPHFQALLFRLQLLLRHDSGRSSCFDPLKIRLDATNRFAHTHDDLLPHTHERRFGVFLLQLPLAVGAPG